MPNFDLQPDARSTLLNLAISQLDEFYQHTADYAVSPDLDVGKIRMQIESISLESGGDPQEAVSQVIQLLKEYSVHTPHPMYFGLFNPRPAFPSVLADLITGWMNPQLAAWSHAPFANEVEKHLVESFCKKFGYPENSGDGVFATGGGEANLTAVICAVNFHFPEIASQGFIGMTRRPLIYCSAESHHTILKSARMIGLGSQSVVSIPVDQSLRMDIPELLLQIEKDLEAGHKPFMLVATAGTTGAGSIDPLSALTPIIQKYKLWFHVDAAYGGAAMFSAQAKKFLKGIENSDSITFDLHKWFSLGMATSVFLCNNKSILHKSFGTNTAYMPREASELEVIDPYTHSVQWSRRFIGLKAYMALLFFGWDGFEEVIDYQLATGIELKKLLLEDGWEIKNQSPLPVLCFTDPQYGDDPAFASYICTQLIKSGEAWLSVYPVNGQQCLRACITNYASKSEHLLKLVQLLNQFRAAFSSL
ncbi:MAG: hypothetical protein KDC34_01340 [Saprospiraceae bacterium]|nr:hypothetical protein [Saprospiraceae bacterium]